MMIFIKYEALSLKTLPVIFNSLKYLNYSHEILTINWDAGKDGAAVIGTYTRACRAYFARYLQVLTFILLMLV